MDPINDKEKLQREISRLAIAALMLNGLIGAGIFGLPSSAAKLTGAFSPLMFVICGLLMSTVMLSFGQAASYFPNTGGPILYSQAAFGPLVGFETGWVLYIGRASALAANSNLLITYSSSLWEGADQGFVRIAILLVVCALFTAINFLGIKQGIGTVLVMTVMKLIPLFVFILVGLSFVKPDAFKGAGLPTYSNFGEATLLLFYAFIGFEGGLIPAGEARDPKRDMPRALFMSAGFTTVLYVLIQTVSMAVMPDLANAKRPLVDAAGIMMGAAGALLITFGAIISIGGNIAATFVTAPRMTYTLAREGGMPKWFEAVHERYRTPHWSILFFGTLVFALALSGTFTWLAGMSSLTRVLGYGICVAALPRLQKQFGNTENAIRLPGGLLIPALALIVCLWLLTQAKLDALFVTAGFLLAGAIFYATARRKKAHYLHLF
jgi:amino acid transporter